MKKHLLTTRRGFLKGAAAALGAATLAGTLGKTEGTLGHLLGSPSTARAQDGTYPLNKMSAVLPAPKSKIVLETPHLVKEISPGIPYELWSYGGSAPGPILHVKEGEEVDFTLSNTSPMTHSIDFHAALLPWNVYYQGVMAGEKYNFKWVPKYPGIFMYHCGSAPVIMHLGNGMHGAIVVQPKNGWPEKAREYFLVQHEFYYSDPDDKGIYRGDVSKMLLVQPSLVVFNGYANQYRDEPLVADPGELVRIHIVNCGPSLFSAFHVIGTLFTAAYADGNPANKQVGMQTVTIPPGGGYTVEMRFPDEGLYPFVTHSFAYPGLGALGVIKVGNPKTTGTASH